MSIGLPHRTPTALIARRDRCTTVLPLRPDKSVARPLLLFAGLEEVDADLVAIDPGELAAAVGQSRRRQQQEEFLRCKPSTEPSTVSLAPVSETSSITQLRRQVPSMPIMCAEKPRSNTTRSPLRRSTAAMTAIPVSKKARATPAAWLVPH